jgi:glycosyltransferase involved in cell wall biosynthesis
MPVPHIVHVMPSFSPGGAQARTVQIMNYLGESFCHTVVSLNGDFTAAGAVSGDIDVQYLRCRRGRNPIYMIRQFAQLLRALKPNLVLTYNWGAIDGVVAARIAGGLPVIHSEDGFGADEALRQKRRRILFRTMTLRSAYRVVAPSETLVDIMLRIWRLPGKRIEHIPNGIDLNRFAPEIRRPEQEQEKVILGAVGVLRPEKNHELLLSACAAAARRMPIRLIIAGDGPERKALEEKVQSLGLTAAVEFLGHCGNPTEIYRRLDLFVLSSKTEQMPLAVLEAMASGLPVVSTDVGDVKKMVSPENRPFIVSGEKDFYEALTSLAANPALRKNIGVANRARCIALYDIRKMLQRYSTLYENAIRSSYVAQN